MPVVAIYRLLVVDCRFAFLVLFVYSSISFTNLCSTIQKEEV